MKKLPIARRGLLVLSAITATLLAAAPAALAAPANDAFANARTIVGSTVSGGNLEASMEAGEPNHAGNVGGRSVWFSWTAPGTGRYGIGTAGCISGIEAVVAVYTGLSVNALTLEGDTEGSASVSFCPFAERPVAEIDAIGGTEYRIAVDGRNGAQGSFQLQIESPPTNDDFADAQALDPALPQAISASNRISGREGGEPEHAGDPGGHSVWYSWTPTSSGQVEVFTCSPFSNLDSLLGVYTGATVGSLTPVAANDDDLTLAEFPECTTGDSALVFDAVAGTTYRIAVDGAGGGAGRFNLKLRGRPQNDDFAAAQPLAGSLPIYAEGSNLFSTRQPDEPDHGIGASDGSVWYSWISASSGSVAISACGDEGLAVKLAIYTGVSLGELDEVPAGENSAPCGSHYRLSVTAGTKYWIAVDGPKSGQRDFTLLLEPRASNDEFSAAKALPSDLPVMEFASNRYSTNESFEPLHAGYDGRRSVWYSWTAVADGPVQISACPNGREIDLVLGVYTGSAVDALTKVASDADSTAACSELGAAVQFDAVAGTIYRIAVDTKGGGEGPFLLDLRGAPGNDDFDSPEVLPSEPFGAGAWTTFATKQTGEPDHAGKPGGHSVWFEWTPTASGPTLLTACGRNRLDALLAVYTGTSLDSLTEVAASDDTAPEPANERCESPRDSEVRFDAMAGTTYRIAVDAKNGAGQILLAFEAPPANDDFDDAQELWGSLPLSAIPVTDLASRQGVEPAHAGQPGARSVWYSWTAARSGLVAISTCTRRGDLDALLGVYTGDSLGALTPVASGDGGATEPGCRSTDVELQLNATAGTTYRIAVDGKNGSAGFAQLTIDGAAPHDDFSKPEKLGASLPTQAFTSSRFADKQSGEPNHAGNSGGASVWFKWTAPRTETVSIDTCDSSFDTLLAIYTGGTPASLTPVAANDDSVGKCAPQSKVALAATKGTVYRIAVDGKGSAQGAVGLHIEHRHRNDDFNLPDYLPEASEVWMPGSNLLATKQTEEPDHDGDPGGRSVWFGWRPPEEMVVQLEVCTRTFEPVIAIYTGNFVHLLEPVATAEVTPSACDEGRAVRFAADPETGYNIVVDGEAGESGQFDLHLWEPLSSLHTLSIVRAGGGSGTVSSAPAGIACGATCGANFEAGTAVTLSADPNPGSTFAGWSGGGCSGTGTCQVTLGADTTVTATFQPLPAGDGGNGGSGGGGPTPTPTPKPKPKPLKCKPGFKKVKGKGKQKCIKKKPGKHKGRGKGKSHGQKK